MAPYICRVCEREFGSPAALGSHRRTHAPGREAPVSSPEPEQAKVAEPATYETALTPAAPLRPVAIIVTLPPNVTQVLIRGVAVVGDVEVDVRTAALDRVWSPIDLRGGEFRCEDAS